MTWLNYLLLLDPLKKWLTFGPHTVYCADLFLASSKWVEHNRRKRLYQPASEGTHRDLCWGWIGCSLGELCCGVLRSPCRWYLYSLERCNCKLCQKSHKFFSESFYESFYSRFPIEWKVCNAVRYCQCVLAINQRSCTPLWKNLPFHTVNYADNPRKRVGYALTTVFCIPPPGTTYQGRKIGSSATFTSLIDATHDGSLWQDPLAAIHRNAFPIQSINGYAGWMCTYKTTSNIFIKLEYSLKYFTSNLTHEPSWWTQRSISICKTNAWES